MARGYFCMLFYRDLLKLFVDNQQHVQQTDKVPLGNKPSALFPSVAALC